MPRFIDEEKALKTISNMKKQLQEIEESITESYLMMDVSYLIERLERQAVELRNTYK